MARSSIKLFTFNPHVPIAIIRTSRSIKVQEENSIQFESYLNKDKSTIVDVIQRIKSNLAK
jgi:hypothetical protein